MAGRPSKFTKELADEIARRLSDGEPMAVICRDEHMPDRTTVFRWTQTDEAFSQRIACAREDGFDAIAIAARKTIRGYGLELGGESTGDVQRDKAIVETDLKLLAKWDPKRYGDKLAHVGGGDGDPPIKTSLTVSFV
jgi:hypothetical protein